MPDHDRPASGPTIIEPIDFRGVTRVTTRRRPIGRWLAFAVLAVLGVAVAVSGWFVLTAQQVQLTFDPTPERMDLGGPPLRFRLTDHYLLRPGVYTVTASLTGYHDLEETIEVGAGETNFHFTLRELPGLVSFHCVGADTPDATLDGVRIIVDDEPRGVTPADEIEIEPGAHTVRFARERYQDHELTVNVAGRAERQRVDVELRPDWGDVVFESTPPGAEIRIDGVARSTTPCTIEVDSGPRSIEVTADGYDSWRRDVTILPESEVAYRNIVLERTKGRVRIVTDPAGAQVMIDDRYAGVTPLEVDVEPDRELRVELTRDGYEHATRTVRVGSHELEIVDVDLDARIGTVRLDVTPSGTTLIVDGVPFGDTPEEIALSSEMHQLEFRRGGYVTQTRDIRPRPGIVQRVSVTLEEEAPAVAIGPASGPPVTATGMTLVLIEPAPFTMGSSRREQGRRSNETLRAIDLRRPFLLGAREVTNAEFKAFRVEHVSGLIEDVSLSDRDMPVVQVTWDDATRFCNWLSRQDNLPPAYEEFQGAMRTVTPMTTGYRLPTEAEWEFATRYAGPGILLKYPWGDSYPPPAKAGNYADVAARSIVGLTIPGYEDGHAGSAPVASFAPNRFGVHDLGGNVAEWCHDFYTTYSYNAERTVVDPLGPKQGRHHVVRGASWRHASVGALRGAWRDYSEARRDDLGFRICRYVATETRDGP